MNTEPKDSHARAIDPASEPIEPDAVAPPREPEPDAASAGQSENPAEPPVSSHADPGPAGAQAASGRPRIARWIVLLVTVLAVLVAAGLGWRPLARQQRWLVDGGSPSIAPSLFAPKPSAAPQGAGVIDPASGMAAQPLDAAKVDAALAAVPAQAAGNYSSLVLDLATGQPVWNKGADTPVIAASATKLLTTMALVNKIGPQASFATTVVSPGAGQLILVGGGDPLLTSADGGYPASYPKPASLADLAQQTAAALRAQGIGSVALGYDDTLLTGPDVHPSWAPGDLAYVARVHALLVDEASGGANSADPAAQAAGVFAAQLRAQGITVTGTPGPAKAPAGVAPLAAVHSLSVATLAQQTLLESDNTAAEVLFRQLALAYGKPASFEGGAAALTEALNELGLWQDGMRISDGSGLSMDGRLTARALAGAVSVIDKQPGLRPLLEGLPVAGLSGTLADRFGDSTSAAGRGFVRAKTGTLDSVGALTGYLSTPDGGLAAFAIVGNNASGPIKPYLDHWSSALAGCACASR